jgi:hypothetical protein
METHTIKVTKDITRLWYMNDVVPAIIAQWPAGYRNDITINQDNAPIPTPWWTIPSSSSTSIDLPARQLS